MRADSNLVGGRSAGGGSLSTFKSPVMHAYHDDVDRHHQHGDLINAKEIQGVSRCGQVPAYHSMSAVSSASPPKKASTNH